ncbi:MAG: ABC-2 family transporter protein [Deinococcus sp.]|nr:ABC-2 family transporter protein [Deinococcus sp.]
MHPLRLYLALISVRIRAQMQYRASFALDVLGTCFGTFVSFITLAAVFGRFGNIGGWKLGEVAFLYGLVETSLAVADMLFGGFDTPFFSELIRRGTLDQLLLRPLSLVLQVFGADFVLRRLGRIAQGVFVFGLGLYLTDLAWTPLKGLYLPLVFVSTVAFFGSLFVMGATLCFWTVQPAEVMNIFTYGGSEMLSYPMHIYSDWLRRFFTFVVPAALLVYYPTLYFLDKPDPSGSFLPFLAPLAGWGMLALSFACWQVGLRHYQSTGT